jgi:glutamine synthetase
MTTRTLPSATRADVSEAEAFFAAHPQVDAIDMIFSDFAGVPRGKRLTRDEVLAVYTGGRYFPGSIVVVDVTGRDTEETGLVWEDGDADRSMKPVPGTLVLSPWAGPRAAQFLVSFYELDGTPHDLDSRHILGRVVDRLAADGHTPVMAIELEFYLLDARRNRDGSPRVARPDYNRTTPTGIEVYGMRELEDMRPFIDALHDGARVQGLPLESAISEYAPGQFELTLRHKADAIRACDDAIMYKRLVKATAQSMGYEATFMAKPFADSAGSGMHIHVSMNDEAEKNAFASDDPEGSPLLKQAVAGMMATIADGFAIYAPHANSYRRFRANSYAPVAPTWGVNNRTVSFRVPAGAPPTRHIEHRCCGADANPYLAAAAVLAGIHHGFDKALDPGPAVVGNGYDQAEKAGSSLPRNWFAAVDAFEGSALMRDYLGDRFVTMYSCVKRVEQDRFFAEVMPLDYQWYLRNA